MFSLLIYLTVLGMTLAEYAGISSNQVPNQNGYGYGYSGSYSGNGNNPNFDLGFLNQYFESFKKYHENFLNNIQQQAEQLSTLAQNSVPIGGDILSNGKNVDGSAVASASLGPQGGYQTAAVFPENPSSPNIFSRFAETSQPGTQGGQYSVFTSSISSSSNVDGKPQNIHRATTTVNDNGKVSTYTVSNP